MCACNSTIKPGRSAVLGRGIAQHIRKPEAKAVTTLTTLPAIISIIDLVIAVLNENTPADTEGRARGYLRFAGGILASSRK